MRKIWILLIAAAGLCAGCRGQQTLKEKQAGVTTGKIDDSFNYICKEVGWETHLPTDWNLLTKHETDKINAQGKELLEKTIGAEVDMSALRELVNLKKDAFNSFLSTIERYDPAIDGSYAEHSLKIDKIISDAYTEKKIKFESKPGSEKIDNVDFHTLEIKIFVPGSDKILMNQKMYGAFLKGYDFGMVINYNNDADKETLLKIVQSSKFL